MKVDKLMIEVDHGARRAYEERAAASEPGAGESPRTRRETPAPSDAPPERGERHGRHLRRDLGTAASRRSTTAG